MSFQINKTTPPKKSNNLFQTITKVRKVDRLRKRFSVADWCSRYRWFRHLCQLFSILAQIASVAFALQGVIWLFNLFMSPWLSAPIAALLLICLEVAKRKTSDNFWDMHFGQGKVVAGWLMATAFFALLSAASSVGGVYLTVQKMNENPPVAHDPTLLELEAEKNKLDGDILKSQKTTWQGKITRNSQAAIKEFSKSQTALLTNILDRKNKLDKKNDALAEEHKTSVFHLCLLAFLIYILFEMLFESSMAFMSYFDFRDYLETETLTEAAIAQFINPRPTIEIPSVMLPAAESPKPPPETRRPMGFFNRKKPVSNNAETTVSNNAETTVSKAVSNKSKPAVSNSPKPSKVKQPQTPVKQVFKPVSKPVSNNTETTVSKAVSNKNETPVSEKETIVIVDSNVRYLKQKTKQAFRRSKTQKDPTTSLKNYKRLRGQLEGLNITVEEVETTKKGKVFYDLNFKQNV